MSTAILLLLCLAADAPVSTPLPITLPAAGRVLREDERDTVVRSSRSGTAAAIASQVAAARATSVTHPSTGCLFDVPDPTPRFFAIHDLVAILVSESSKSKSSADSKADKDYNMEAEVGAFMTMDLLNLDGEDVNLPDTSLPAFDVSAGKGFKGKASANRTDDFTARVTAEIVDIRPNGLLVLEARREIVNDGETQVIMLSGVCRPEDVSAGNTVLSQSIADAVIKKVTTGQLRDTSEKGILAKLLDAVFAF